MFTRNLALAAVLVLLAACAHLSVIHLDKRPWILGQEDRLAMRYWNFSYTSRLEGNNIVVDDRSEERRVGKECRSRWSPYH